MESDAELLGRTRGGDPAPFVEVVQRHERVIYRYLSRRAGKGPAEDLLSDVWAAAFQGRATFDPAWHSARPWLFGIARNRLRSYWRQQRPAAAGTEAGLDPWPEVDTRLAISARAAEIGAALGSLPADELEVLLLVAWEELTPSEAAVALGIPAGTARSRLHRARAALREELKTLVDSVTGAEPEIGGGCNG
jgi:RNA polymerase sigma-70 factor (ECF subfamily)